jgi:hypothetical protein
MSGTAPYYTQEFSPLPGRCFCLVAGGEGGGPTHCPDPPVWRARHPRNRRSTLSTSMRVSVSLVEAAAGEGAAEH